MSEQPEGAVVRRNPFAELESWNAWAPLRNIVDEFFAEWPSYATRSGASLSSVDITETDDDYRVRVELPGVAKDDVTVELEGGVLCIRGEKKSRRDETLERGRRLECSYGSPSREASGSRRTRTPVRSRQSSETASSR